MKSSRRHELQTNELAEWLERAYRRVQPYVKWVGLGALVVLVVVVLVSISSYRRQVAEGRAWAELLSAVNSTSADSQQVLQDIAVVHQRTSASVWASITRADANVMHAMQRIYQNQDEARKLLQDAVDTYQQVLPRVSDSYLLQRVNFSLGQAYEALGNLREAETAYRAALAPGETTAFGQAAKQRLDQLSKDDLRTFYDWFVAQRSPIVPQPGTTVNPHLPDRPDFSVPGVPATGQDSQPKESSSSRAPTSDDKTTSNQKEDSPPEGDKTTDGASRPDAANP